MVHQRATWVDRRGDRHSIPTMNRHHRHYVIAFLRRSAPQLAMACAVYEMQVKLQAGATVDITVRVADGVWTGMRTMLPEYNQEPRDWLESTPLMRELVACDLHEARVGDGLRRRARTAWYHFRMWMKEKDCGRRT